MNRSVDARAHIRASSKYRIKLVLQRSFIVIPLSVGDITHSFRGYRMLGVRHRGAVEASRRAEVVYYDSPVNKEKVKLTMSTLDYTAQLVLQNSR